MLWILLAILVAACAALIGLLVWHRLELKSISGQLKEIRNADTNATVHSAIGSKASAELINEINYLLRQLNDEKISYKKKRHDLDKMMTNISHDLRTPLTSALGFMEMLRNEDIGDNEKLQELEIVDNRLRTLEKLINQFFEFSRSVSADGPPDISPVNVVGLLEECTAESFDDFSASDRKILMECPETKLVVLSNKEMLGRIFGNLIANSFRHGCGDLTVRVEKDTDVRMVFSNRVEGEMPDPDRVFEEFYTKDISRTSGNTGLGLAIAKQFAELIGGRITAGISGDEFFVELHIPFRNF